jgi:hypothetical protein
VSFLSGGGRSGAEAEDHRRVREALFRLDPWSFWSVPLDDSSGADYAVVGTTGAFAIAICALEGYAEPAGSGLRIGETKVDSFRALRQVARTLRGRLSDASVFTDVQPVLCLTRAIAGAPRTVRAVRVMRFEDLATEIGGRERTLDFGTAKNGAMALGTPLPRVSGARSEDEEPPG